MSTVLPFTATPEPPVGVIGGKASSLTRLTHAGFPVPPGFTLTTGFFQPWIDALCSSVQWTEVRRALEGQEELRAATEALKERCGSLRFSPAQDEAIARALAGFAGDSTFAVRSSSPEEDLTGASFAGGYETTLGVKLRSLRAAVLHTFTSAFDERVFVYKARQGFAVGPPRIAVIVQLQVDASAAGVGFSLNPLNNDYDEVVINANAGLGESVVAGAVSPDHFVVDKVSRGIVERQLGSKERVVELVAGGGVRERSNEAPAAFCLTDEEVAAIADLVVRVEDLYGVPVDIEWALAGQELHLLQARPITTYVPLPPEMMTEPGERRRLYFDFGLVDIMTNNQPMTPLTLDWTFGSLGMWITPFTGPLDLRADAPPAASLLFGAGGRTYVNFSQLLALVDLRRFAGSGSGTSQMDEITARLLANIDVDRYRATRKIPALRWFSLLRRLPGLAVRSALFGVRVLRAMWRPRSVHREFERVIEEAVRRLKQRSWEHVSVRESITLLDEELTPVIGRTATPPMSVYMNYMMRYMGRVDRLVDTGDADDEELARALSRGFSGNVATRIGIQLHRMAKMLGAGEMADLDDLARRIDARAMPEEFLAAWDAFVDEFGSRGPSELELSNPRYGDDPRVALEQMSYMAGSDFDPEAAQNRHIAARQEAYETLLGRLRGSERRTLERVYRILELFGPARETPKYLWVLDNGAVRRRALLEGERFVQSGRLDAPEDIFWLTLDEIDAANADPAVDLRQLLDAKKPFYDKLDRVVTFPHLIDSRGRIGQVERPEGDEDLLLGQGISTGRAVGRVKVLQGPRDKPIEQGDVLVTYTTDPGWTPLFVNAEAIILEIGGMLQHGGVVAREYGKPCVVGIQGITRTLEDGMMVEVDGAAGTVRLLGRPVAAGQQAVGPSTNRSRRTSLAPGRSTARAPND